MKLSSLMSRGWLVWGVALWAGCAGGPGSLPWSSGPQAHQGGDPFLGAEIPAGPTATPHLGEPSVSPTSPTRAPATGESSAAPATATIRGQQPSSYEPPAMTPGSDNLWRYPMPANEAPPPGAGPYAPAPATGVAPANYQPPQNFQPPPAAYQPPPNYQPPPGAFQPQGPILFTPPPATAPPPGFTGALPPPASWPGAPIVPPGGVYAQPPLGRPADIEIQVEETRTGRFMFGVGVNSDAGVTGQIVVDERNFDFTRIPTSFEDWVNGTAFRGAGQGFRLEAMPGSQLQRYLVSFTEPYLFDTPISLNLSGFYFQRRYFDFNEDRVGGRIGLGYSLTPDLAIGAALRMENVEISRPRVLGVPQLDAALGNSALYTSRFSLSHDTRDSPFAATEGYYFEMAYEQAFGDFNYPRGELDFRKYFLVHERPDGSGRHTVSANFRLGVSGADTPLFENFYAGGYSTLRGFDFRGANPVVNTVSVGGRFRFLGSAEYMFPITADDMLRGVVFCDFGTVEESVKISGDTYRVAPGFGMRIFVPAMGPAPIALDFAFPVAKADFDDTQVFSFFVGFGR